jgi:hypothetical protein
VATTTGPGQEAVVFIPIVLGALVGSEYVDVPPKPGFEGW